MHRIRVAVSFLLAAMLPALLWAQPVPAAAAPPVPARGSALVAAAAPDGVLHAVTPTRLLDTRSGLGRSASGPVGAGRTIDLVIVGRAPIPATGVTAVVLNVTAVSPTAATYVTVWPAGGSRPLASNLNVRAGETRPNLVQVGVGDNGRVSLFNAAGAVHLIADVAGWIGPAVAGDSGGEQRSAAPERILDTRSGIGAPAVASPAGATLELQVTGRGGIPADSVSAVVLNVTVTSATASTYVTVSPSGTPRPLASNLNVSPGRTVANRVIVKVGANGRVALFHPAGTMHLIADVGGWFTNESGDEVVGSGFQAVSPARLVDTRDGTGAPTAKLGPGGSLIVSVAGAAGVPGPRAAVPPTAVVANITATRATAASYLTAWPAGTPRPVASDLNFVAGDTVPNLAIVKLGASGSFTLYNASGSVDVIVDVLGWYAGDVVLKPEALPLTAAESAAVSAISPSSITFASTPGMVSQLTPGDVVVSGPTPQAPAGFLRRVTSVVVTGQGREVATEQAALDDVLAQGALAMATALEPSGGEGQGPEQAAETAISVGGELVLPFSATVSSGGGSATLGGEVAISAGVELDIEIGFFGLQHARFAASAGQRFSASLDATYTGSWSYGPVELGSYTFAPITFSIGPVPVVAQPSLSASLNASGAVDASLHASLTQAESVTASLTYDGEDVVPDFERTSVPATFSGPTAGGLATGRVSVDPKVSLTLYGAAEVGVTLSAYLRVEADLCLAELFGGISVAASFALSILGHDLLDFSSAAATLAEARLASTPVLGCWTGSFRYVSTLDVSSGGFTSHVHTDVTWTVLERVEDAPNHYRVQVEGTFDEHDVEVTSFPAFTCRTETTMQGTVSEEYEVVIHPEGAGWRVQPSVPAGSPYPTATGSMVRSGTPGACPQDSSAVSTTFVPTWICAPGGTFVDQTVTLGAFDGSMDENTEQCTQQVTWSFVRET